ncbi:MAG: hypothetical protein WCF67_21450 [Chitinophagaceae bacterium]
MATIVLQAAVMSKNFMIGFMYEGYFYCANVHRSHMSPAEYQVVILSNKLSDGVPQTMVLRDVGNKLIQTSGHAAPSALLTNVLAEIEKHLSVKG